MKLPAFSIWLLTTATLGLAPHATAQAPVFHHVQGGDVNGIFMLNATTGWTAEDGGRIRYTLDGSTWTHAQVPDDVRDDLRSVFFLNASEGWAVGDGGAMLKSTNGGVTWTWGPGTSGPLPGEPDLYGVQFLSSTNGWAVGLLATVLHFDGTSWQPITVDCISGHIDAYDVHFFDLQEGFIAMDRSTVIYTSNGGTSWTCTDLTSMLCPPLPPPSCEPNLELWALDFPDAQTGYMVGGSGTNRGYVFRAEKSGTSWSWTQESCFDFLADTCGPPDPDPCNHTPPTLYGVTALSSTQVFSAGYAATVLERTNALGGSPTTNCSTATCPSGSYHWDQVTAFSGVSNPPLSAAADAGGEVWTVGGFNFLRKYTPSGGGGWATDDQAGSIHLRMMDGVFTSASTGFMVGQGPAIVYTDDSGVSFRHVHGPAYCATNASFLRGIAMAGQVGVAVGDNVASSSTILRTDTGGDTAGSWSSVLTSFTSNLEDVAFGPSGGVVYAVGSAGTVLKSTSPNPGTSWVASSTGILAADVLYAIACATDSRAFVVGRGTSAGGAKERRAYRTANSGNQWVPIPFIGGSTDVALKDVQVSPSGVVFAVAEMGEVYQYDSGSSSFLQVDLGSATSTNNLNGLAFVPVSGKIFAVGDNGFVLHFDGTSWSTVKSQTSHPLHSATFFYPALGYVMGVRFGLVKWQ